MGQDNAVAIDFNDEAVSGLLLLLRHLRSSFRNRVINSNHRLTPSYYYFLGRETILQNARIFTEDDLVNSLRIKF